jgi:hypothetical protein
MKLFKVIRTSDNSEAGGLVESMEFLAEGREAWHLWHWLTTMASEEEGRRERMVVEKKGSMLLSASFPKISVKVFDLCGHELRPQYGVDGILCRDY